MPRKHEDPIVRVLDYFELAGETELLLVIQMAKSAHRRRFPTTAVPTKSVGKKSRATTRKEQPLPGPTATVGDN